MQLASEARNVGVDLWHYQTADGRSILRAAEFMARFADPGSTWRSRMVISAQALRLANAKAARGGCTQGMRISASVPA